MRTLVLLLASSLVINSALAAVDPPSDKLAFVYEMVRHGARAPLLDEPEGYFDVGAGILTSMGMR